MSSAVALKRPQADSEERRRAVTAVLAVVARHFGSTSAVAAMVREEGPLQASSPSVVAIFEPKSTGTIVKRAASLRLYDAWHSASHLAPGSLLDEAFVFQYVHHLKQTAAPATRASATCSALAFLGGLFGVDPTAVRRSARIFGICCAMLRDGAVRRQRQPLTVPMVKALE